MFVNLIAVLGFVQLCVLCIGTAEASCGTSLGYTYDFQTGRCYKFHSQAKNWVNAVHTCQTESASLGVPNNWLENMVFMINFLQHPKETIQNATASGIIFIGIHREPSGRWFTVDGQTPQFTKWARDYPKEGENFAYMASTGYWMSSQSHQVAFLCEKPAVG